MYSKFIKLILPLPPFFEIALEEEPTSLNHALGEMNFLLEAYQQTKEESYLDVARNMR
ncbi:hypothetical protein [Lysinibacillus sp. FJAT-14745]|uniref:hypothetical protein n=1 Tax=Lysinibacillus sp. FJAT-14745 TaxID=1704289 RepID=UPI000B2B1F9D|nr:hypothetical protein [Lysinibacillus sp. FJAT-14745]